MWNAGASIASWRLRPSTACPRNSDSDHWSCWSPPGVPNARRVPSSCSASEGVSVVRGRRPGASELAKPSSSQNICARVPRQKPRPPIAGELCSQPPLGVAETRLPWRSATSRWQVSPSVGSPIPTSPAAAAAPGGRGIAPSSPGRSSPEACGPTSVRRSRAYSRLSSAASGTGALSP